ncbi:hypothetical protein BYT27DRAFT_7254705 [Phlegmacium glaucopus]|nr:hypothetical protein BYT27DRAFT_7254705 [Phlegmacium glaucopus]
MPTAFSGISNYRADYELSTDAYNDERTRTSDCSVLNQDKHLSSLPPRYEAESFTDADSPSRHIQLSIMNYPPMSTMTKELPFLPVREEFHSKRNQGADPVTR